jgi:sporulation protein YlmC with PRC-barrel domain
MNLADPIKLVSQLVDLPIVDKDERSCGIVDDVELDGAAGKETRIKALLVGPGAYRRRMPGWLYWLVRRVAGDRMARVPATEIMEIGAVVKLKCAAEKVKLHVVENRASTWIPRWGAL